MSTRSFRWPAFALLGVCLLTLGMSNRSIAASPHAMVRQIMVPDEDRFTPFAITVRVGQPVQWVNNDTDDHTVVSNDAFNLILPATGVRMSFFRRMAEPSLCVSTIRACFRFTAASMPCWMLTISPRPLVPMAGFKILTAISALP
jgi:hypothetical protein